MKQLLKPILPYIIAIGLFYAFTAIYFYPSLNGKVIQSSDITSFTATATEMTKYRKIEEEKDAPQQILWSNSLFSGMPTYMITGPKWKNKTPDIKKILARTFNLNRPFYAILGGLLGIFLLLVVLGVNHWLAIVGAFTYYLASFHYILIAHGHNAKIIVVSLFSYVLIGLILLFKHKKYFWGPLLFTFALVWQITAAHVQMTYYLIFISVGYYISQAVVYIRAKEYKELTKISSLLAVGVLLALSTNTGKMWTEYEYAKHTMRGGREITQAGSNEAKPEKAGLSNEYILSYSYDFGEAFSGIMPQAKGLYKPLPENSSLYKALVKSGNAKVAKSFNKEGRYFYWGHQTASAAPFYYGVVMFVLFVLGLFLVKGQLKYWLGCVALLTFILTIGKNTSGDYAGFFYGIQCFFIKHVPFYDKFRDVKNIVTVQSLSMVILAFVGVSRIISGEVSKPEIKKALKNTAIATGALFIIIALVPTILGSTASARDAIMFKGWPLAIIEAMRETRGEAIRSDAFRGLMFGGATLGLLFLFTIDKLKANVVMLVLMGIIAIDMLPQDLKALNHDTFVSKKQEASVVKESKADKIILKDKEMHYRVYKFGDSFNDAFTSKYHKSIGGYSAAKLSRYQDLIEYSFTPFTRNVGTKKTSQEQMNALFSGHTMNMLNTKYFILNPEGAPVQNPNAYGNAWFANDYKVCKGARQEMTELNKVETKTKIVLDEAYADQLGNKKYTIDPSASIKLTAYHPNVMTYAFDAQQEQLTVFSEIFYAPNGWQAYIDGEKAEHFRANYLLRAMVVPAGKHTIEFKFEPQSYFLGTKISLVCSYLLTLLLIGGLAFEGFTVYKKYKK